jgi:uncharacterized membrane protein
MNASTESAVLFSAVLRPHRSGGTRALRSLLLLLGVVIAAVGLMFLAMGAWPVLPFLGLEVVLLIVLLRLNLKRGSEFEAINLTRSALTVRRVDHWGQERHFSFPPNWLQVNLEPAPGDDTQLELRSHGRSLTIARFLPAAEREELALTLRRALQRITAAA